MAGIDKTELLIADADLPLAFLELSDEALAKFCRRYLMMVEEQVHASAGEREMPVSLAMSMHGAIALYRIAFEANAGELHLTHEGVEWGGEQRGDWEIIIRCLRSAQETAQ